MPPPRCENYQLRLTTDELTRWRDAAERSGRTLAEFLRDGAEGEIARLAGEPARELTLEERLREMGLDV